jgi:hypothetical protein
MEGEGELGKKMDATSRQKKISIARSRGRREKKKHKKK